LLSHLLGTFFVGFLHIYTLHLTTFFNKKRRKKIKKRKKRDLNINVYYNYALNSTKLITLVVEMFRYKQQNNVTWQQ